MGKKLKVTLICVVSVIVALGGFLLIWFLCDIYPDFRGAYKKEFSIYGLDTGFTPQGLTYSEERDVFLYCGYMNDGSKSRVYIVDADDYDSYKYFTIKINGEDYVGHSGGIASQGYNCWIVGDHKIIRFDIRDVDNLANGGYVNAIDSMDVPNGADFVTVQDDYLWIGEFYRKGNYETEESHHIKTDSGMNMALSLRYSFDNSKTCGISEKPNLGLSTGELIQGMAVDGNKIYLSTSYGLKKSKIYKFTTDFNVDTIIQLNGVNLPICILDMEKADNVYVLPSMSEELIIQDDKLFVMFENACKKYHLFTRERLKNVYSIELN